MSFPVPVALDNDLSVSGGSAQDSGSAVPGVLDDGLGLGVEVTAAQI